MFPDSERFAEPVLLGEGTLGRVYQAEDAADGSRIAVKVLHPVPPWAMYRLQSEFSTLLTVEHRNIVSPLALHDNGEPCLITMPHIDGPTLPEWLATSPDPGALQEVFGQLTRALMALHAHGLLHRNLKPDNVRIDRSGVVKLLDAGLAGLLFDPHTAPDAPHTRYQAPELRADPAAVTPASDWYSLGVMLAEQTAGTDGPLAALCAALAHPDPAWRPDGIAILAALAATRPWPPGRPVARPFVGREAPLEALEACWQQRQEGPVVALLIGLRGSGATTLAERFLARHRDEADVVTIRCHAPSRLPSGVLNQLVEALPTVTIDGLSPALTQVFPALRARPGRLTDAPLPPDPRAVRFQALDDLRALLVNATTERALVVFIDDIHCADAISARVLADLLTADVPARLLLLCTCPAERVADAAFLQSWTELEQLAVPAGWMHRIPVPPLSDAAIHDLLEQQGLRDPAQRDRIVATAGGSPLFAERLLRMGLTGAAAAPRLTIRQALTRHLATLPPRQRRILGVLSAAQQPISLELLSGIIGEDIAEDVAALVDDALITPPPDVALAHELLQDTLQGHGVPTLDHHALALALMEDEEDPAGMSGVRICWHLLAAGTPGDAISYAITTADRAAAALQLEAAEERYRLALEHLPPSDSRRKRVVAAASAVMVRLGQARDAAPLLEEIAALRGEDEDWQRRAAEQWIAAGEHVRGLEMLQSLLERAGIRWPSGRAERGLLLRLGMTRLRLQQLPEGWDTGSPEPAAQHRMALCWTAAQALWSIDPMRVQYLLMTGLQHALRAKTSRQAARFGLLLYATRGPADRLAACRDLARRIGQPELRALSIWMSAAMLHAGAPAESIPQYEEAIQLFERECPEATWESGQTRAGLLDALWWAGQVSEMGTRWRDNLKRARSLKDQSLWCAAALCGGRLALLEGRLGRARERVGQILQRARPSAEHLHARLLSIRCALYAGELSGVGLQLDATTRSLEDADLQVMPALHLHLLDLHAAALAALTRARRDGASPAGCPSARALSRAEARLLKQLDRSGRPDMAALAHLHRGSFAAARGANAEALSALSVAEKQLTAAGLLLHAALCAAAAGRLSGTPADADLLGLGVVAPDAMLRAFVPGAISGR